MATFEIQGPDGKKYQIQAPDQATAVQAFQKMTAGKQSGAPSEAPTGETMRVPAPYDSNAAALAELSALSNPKPLIATGTSKSGFSGFKEQTVPVMSGAPQPASNYNPGTVEVPMTEADKANAMARNQYPGPAATDIRPPDATTFNAPEEIANPRAAGNWVLNPATGQYVNRADIAKMVNTPDPSTSFSLGMANAASLGTLDNIYGIGSPFRREFARGLMDASRAENPGTDIAGNIAGGITTPVQAARKAKTLVDAVVTGARSGALWGAIFGFNEADDQRQSRVGEALKTGAAASILGAGLAPVLTGAAKMLTPVFTRASRVPVIENLRAMKDAAYRLIDQRGDKVTAPEFQAGVSKIEQELVADGYVPGAGDAATDRLMMRFQKLAERGEEFTLSRLDDLRKQAWEVWSRAKSPGDVLTFIKGIDEMLDAKAGASELFKNARDAFKKYSKAEFLHRLFTKAENVARSTGSGGNEANKFRQAIEQIVDNEKNARWFSAEELAVMQRMLDGSLGEDAMRLIGKLSPSGNGLMAALNIAAISTNPAFSAVTAIGSVSKRLADRGIRKQTQSIFEDAAGLTMPATPSVAPTGNALGVLGDQINQSQQ